MDPAANQRYCLGLLLIGAVVLLVGLAAPFAVPGLQHDMDVIISGFVTCAVSAMLLSLARSKRRVSR